MITPATHIIARQSFRFRFVGAVEAPQVQAEVARLCNEELPDRLNTLFDRLAGPETVLRIPKLDVRLRLDTQEAVPADLGRQLSARIEEALLAAVQNAEATSAAGRADTLLDAIRFYLNRGFLPWWAPLISGADPTNILRELDEPTLAALAGLVGLRQRAGSGFAERLVQLLAAASRPAFLLQCWAGLVASAATSVAMWLRRVYFETAAAPTDEEFQQLLARLVVHPEIREEMPLAKKMRRIFDVGRSIGLIAVHPESSPGSNQTRQLQAGPQGGPELRDAWEQWLQECEDRPTSYRKGGADEPNRSTSQSVKRSNELESASADSAESRIRIPNAGLVLIAPYLEPLFSACKVLENGRLLDPARAVALLRFCCFSNIPCFEQDLVLEKILCGIAPADSPGVLPALTAAEMTECDALLRAVIANWSVLKQTSPEALQQSFIQRVGLLQLRESGWQLRIQRQAHDILLDFIPWSYSILKLPWMQQLVFVDWTG